MTVLEPIRLTCPCCSADFVSKQVVSTNTLGGKRTDFHERAAGTQPLPYLVHMCATCGFTGTSKELTTADVGMMLRERVWDELAPKVIESTTGSAKYEAAAKIATWQSAEPRGVAELLLRAAWCCVDEDDSEAERYFRRLAAWKFEEALRDYFGIERDQRAVLTYLVGELWRRVGDRRLSGIWFDRVPDEITDPRRQRWILDIARQQRDYPQEWFS
jgi:uncharacterized protein (DUF2225 family)